MGQKVLLTGRPGVGKTTLILRFLEVWKRPASGFYTRELRRGGTRIGFEAVGLDGRRVLLAHISQPSPHRVGKYYVHLTAFEREILPLLSRERLPEGGILVVDEIGRMECLSPAFRQAVLDALDAPPPLLGTIGRQNDPFLRAIRERTDILLLEVRSDNRDELVFSILSLMEEEPWQR